MIGDFFGHVFSFIEDALKKEEIWIFLFIIGATGFLGFLQGIDVVGFILGLWWLWLFGILLIALKSIWIFWRQELFKKRKFNFILLEIKLPREIEKSPQAMEQVFMSLHSLMDVPATFEDKYIKGTITTPILSVELVSLGGEIHFYIRVLKKQKSVVEAAFFSFYRDVEILEVKDYADDLPEHVGDLFAEGKDMFGSEIILSREDAYPIKSYTEFEARVEEKEIDPVSVFLEMLSRLKPGDFYGIQLVMNPVKGDWKDRWTKFVAKLREPVLMELKGGASDEGLALFRKMPIAKSPGQVDVLKRVDANLSKSGFSTVIRFFYSMPTDRFDNNLGRGVVGAFNQYGTLDLNSFKTNSGTMTYINPWKWPHFSKSKRLSFRKERLLQNFKKREMPPETWMGRLITSYPLSFNFASKIFVLSTESLATVYHLPTLPVLIAPHVIRSESRKAGPPAGLPIFGEEEEIEKYSE